jgi:hypothetical protein
LQSANMYTKIRFPQSVDANKGIIYPYNAIYTL